MLRRMPFGLSLEGVLEWVYRILLFFCVLGLIYLRSIFATTANLDRTNDKVEAISTAQVLVIPRVEAIERRQSLLYQSQKTTEEMLSTIKQDMAAVRAVQVESAKNTEKNLDRIFSKLDAIAPR